MLDDVISDWINAARAEFIRLGLMPDATDIEAQEVWDILSDHGRDPDAALARDPVEAARAGLDAK